jgi:hypothetical protein
MTALSKPVHRATRGAYRTAYAKPRRVVASFLPGDLLSFRELGRRTRWQLPIDVAFRYAIQLAARTAAAEKRAQRKRSR